MFRLDAQVFHTAAERLPDAARTRFGVQLLVGRLAEHIHQNADGMEYDKALLDDLRALVPLIDDAWFADLSPAKQRSGEFTGLGERWHTRDEIREDILKEAFRERLGGQAIVHLACLSRELPHLFCAYVEAVHDKLFLDVPAFLYKHRARHELAPHFDEWVHPERFCDYDGHGSSYDDEGARLPLGGRPANAPNLRWDPPALQPHDDVSKFCERLEQAVHEALWITEQDYSERLAQNASIATGAVPDFDRSPLGLLVSYLYSHAPEKLQQHVNAERDQHWFPQVGPWEVLHAARMAVRSVPHPLGLWLPDAPRMQRKLVFKDAVQLATVGTCAPTHSPGGLLCPMHALSNPARLVRVFSAVQNAMAAFANLSVESLGADTGYPKTHPLSLMSEQDTAQLKLSFPSLPPEVGFDVVVAMTRMANFWPGEIRATSLQIGALTAPGAEHASARVPLYVPAHANAQGQSDTQLTAMAAASAFMPLPLALMAAGCPDGRLLARMAGRPSPPRANAKDGLSPPTQLGDAPLCAAMRFLTLMSWHPCHPVRRRAASDATWPDVGRTLVKLGLMHACTAATAMAATTPQHRLAPAAGAQPCLCGLTALFRLVALTPEGAAALDARTDRWADSLKVCRNWPLFHAGSKQLWFQTPFGSLLRNDVDPHVRRWLSLVMHMGLQLAHTRGAEAWRDPELFSWPGTRRAIVGGPEGLLCCASATDASDPATNAFVLSPPVAELAALDPAGRARSVRNLETLACTVAVALYSHTVRLLGNPDPATESSKHGLGFLDNLPTFFLSMRRTSRQLRRARRAEATARVALQSLGTRLSKIVADIAEAAGDPADAAPLGERTRRVRRSLWTLLPTPSAFGFTYGHAGAWGDGPAALRGAPDPSGDDRAVYPQEPVGPGRAYAYTLGFALLRNLILAGMPDRDLFRQTLQDMDLGAVRVDEDDSAGGEWVFRLLQFTACVAACDLNGYPEYLARASLRTRTTAEYRMPMHNSYNPDDVARRKAEELTRAVAQEVAHDRAADDHPHRLSGEDAAWTIEALADALPTAACVASRDLVAREALEQVYYRVERAHWWLLGATAKMPPRRHWFPGSEPHERDELWPPYDDDPDNRVGEALRVPANEETLYWLHTCCPGAVWPLYKRGGTGWEKRMFERCLAATREAHPDQVALATQLMLPCPEGLMLDPPESAPFLMRVQQELFAPGGDGYRALLSSSQAAATMVAPGTGSAPGAPAEPDGGGAPAAKRHCADRPSADTASR